MPIPLKTVLILIVAGPALAQSPTVYQEKHRPQFHFSPAKYFMNDPNGLVYDRGEYHLFYQYNPFANHAANQGWGHAVSPDLVHWEHLPVALREEDGIAIWSGSAVVDEKNTSGFGTEGEPPLIAIYTGAGHGKETQNIAFSTDRGRTWTKYVGNPVIDSNSRDFRDPKVLWHEPTQRWIMIVSRAAERKLRFYGSKELKAWTQLSEFGPEGSLAGVWECPDFFPMPIEGEPGKAKWVLKVDVGTGADLGGWGGQYFVGEFDGTTFRNDNPPDRVLWTEHGKDFYAAQSWSNIPEKDGRRIWLAWLSRWEYAQQVPTHPWRSAQSIPRVVTLKRLPEGLRLVQAPVAELQCLRGEHRHVADLAIGAEKPWSDGRFDGETIEIVAEFEADSAAEFGVKVRKGEGEETLIGYDVATKSMFVDRTHSGESGFSPHFAGKQVAPLTADGGKVRLHVFVDTSSVEVFGDDGRAVITNLIFPDPKSQGLEVFAKGGRARLVSLDLWPLKSTWKRP